LKPSSLVFAALLALAVALLHRRLSRTQLAACALLIAWLAIRGSGLLHLPDIEAAARRVGPALGGWTYLAVALLAFLETGFFVGLVAPGEFAVILGGFIAAQGVIDVAVLAPIVFVCAAAGDTTSFYLGRRLGRRFLLRHGRAYGISEQRLERVERFFRGHGAKTILIGRFLGLVRVLAPFIAGASGVAGRRYLPVAYLAAALWSATFVFLGYAFWRSFDTVIAIAKGGTLALGTAIAAIAVGVAVGRWLRNAEHRDRLRRAWRNRSLDPMRGGAR
jgi:membrane protein DedA with SNARE-associated domain